MSPLQTPAPKAAKPKVAAPLPVRWLRNFCAIHRTVAAQFLRKLVVVDFLRAWV